MENDAREEGTMDLDLNLDPPGDSVLELGNLLSELETAHGRIEERIRQLEAVTSRARQRQRWRQSQSSPQPMNIFVQQSETETVADVSLRIEDGQRSKQEERRNDGYKMNSSHLVKKALEMDTEHKKSGSGGDFYDCNICLYMAKDPILTCCGHLFCWSCFYRLSYSHENVKECPACKGDVTDKSIIPIYGNDNSSMSTSKSKSKEPGFELPPRPKAPRIDSVRQQLIARRAFSSPIDILSYPRSIVGDPSRSQQLEEGTQLLAATGTERHTGIQRHHRRRYQVSRLILHGAASFSSVSSALNSAMDSAERLVEDLEAFINNRQVGRNEEPTTDRDSTSSVVAAVQPGSLSVDNIPEIDSAMLSTVTNIPQTNNQTTDSASGEANSNMPPASSSSGNTFAPAPTGTSRERRRRRLR